MTAEELREMAEWLRLDDTEQHDRAADYLRACADALEKGPVAWTLQETLDKRETTYRAYLWFVDPQNSAWAALYHVALPPALRLPEPMTDEEVDALIDETGHMTTDRAVRYLVETGVRRVKEANK